MTTPLMPKATAIWLIDNTSLNFKQIAEFCDLSELEVQAIANGEVGGSIIGQNPITLGQLTWEEIDRCQRDPEAILAMSQSLVAKMTAHKQKKAKYVPIIRRQDKPDAIAWLVKNCPEMTDAQIIKLVGTTKKTIESIRTRQHANMANIRPKDPVLVGICSQTDLDAEMAKARAKAGESGTSASAHSDPFNI